MNDQLTVKDRTVALNRLREQYVPRVYTQHHPIIAVRGDGAWI